MSVKVSLKKVLARLMNTPMIIEQGTEGIWTYRKWSDGTAECWGSKTITSSITNTWGNIYSGGTTTGAVQEDYPTNLFVAAPMITHISEGDTMYLSWSATHNKGTATTTPLIVLLRGTTAGGTQTYTVNIHAIGRWGTVNPSTQTMTVSTFSQDQMNKQEIQALIEASGNQFKDNNIWTPNDLA